MFRFKLKNGQLTPTYPQAKKA